MARHTLVVNPDPKFELSPDLYMQFMEPLGVTDGSVEAGWDFKKNEWREDLVAATADLAPPLLRWGGCISSYYRWKEGVGPDRTPMVNLLWGGVETNRVGTHEFVDFARRVGAVPFFCVNFESDGRQHWAHPPCGGVRTAGPDEAAAWVAYCNDPSNALRRAHGVDEPYDLKLWQIGNETSYDKNGFDCETAAKKTVEFARAMRAVDPELRFIGWGDSGWAKRMYEIAGEYLEYVAFHHMFKPPTEEDRTATNDTEFRACPERTWDIMMRTTEQHADRVKRMREEVAGLDVKLALTEGHFSGMGRNRGDVHGTWTVGVANALLLNIHERNGDVLKIATAADFCGTRWMINAVMMTVPGGKAYLMPVARVMQLYRKHSGTHFVDATSSASDLDVTASRTGGRAFLHVVNKNRTDAVTATIGVEGHTVTSGEVHEIAVDPMWEIVPWRESELAPVKKELPASCEWAFPAASVSAVELETS